MTKQARSKQLLWLTLDPTAQQPLYRQLYDGLRQAILAGRLATGTQLPSTRLFAQELGLSRATVQTAFEQLLAEGYVEGRMGSGTYVAPVLPDELLHVAGEEKRVPEVLDQKRRISQRGRLLAGTSVSPSRYWNELAGKAFRLGQPALDLFPFDIWSRLLAQRRQHLPLDLLSYTNPAGYLPLRQEIAAYVRAARGVKCSEEQVIVVSGAQQGIDLAARLLLDPGDAVWIEDPCYLGTRGALVGAMARIIPVPVDAEGIEVASGVARCPEARLVCVTPSHQFPLGVTMSLNRRLALLQWANRAGAWILEDDYDSEYRYTGRPLASLQGLDTTGRVIYVGTMSKVLFPGLRLGYLVVPPDLVDAFIAARAIADRQPPILDQLILTDFMAQEHFARHQRRMRTIYAERQMLLIEQAKRELGGLLTMEKSEIGMHLVGLLPEGFDDRAASQQSAMHKVIVPALAVYHLESPRQRGLLFGYTASDQAEIQQAVQQLAIALQSLA